MTILIIVILVVVVVALYPVVRDFLRRRAATAPAYVEGLQLLVDGNKSKAVSKLKEAVKADPGNIDAYIRLGDIFIEQQDVEQGLKVHENLALRRNLMPADEKKVYQALAQDYLKTDRKLKAISALEELTRLDRKDTKSHEELFRLYLATGSWEKCENLLKKLGRSPHDRSWTALLFAEFGRAYIEVNPKEALNYFNESLRLDRKSLAGRLYLGDYHMSQHDTEAAIRAWNEILSLAPDKNFLVRHRLEAAYYEVGRYDDITRTYEQLLRKNPEDQGLAVALALIYQKKQNLPAAIRLLEKFSTTRGQLSSRIALAAMHLHQDNSDRAGQLLNGLINQFQSEQLKCGNCGAIQKEPAFSCYKCRAWLK